MSHAVALSLYLVSTASAQTVIDWPTENENWFVGQGGVRLATWGSTSLASGTPNKVLVRYTGMGVATANYLSTGSVLSGTWWVESDDNLTQDVAPGHTTWLVRVYELLPGDELGDILAEHSGPIEWGA